MVKFLLVVVFLILDFFCITWILSEDQLHKDIASLNDTIDNLDDFVHGHGLCCDTPILDGI
jgi:hypothetical protein